MKRSLSLLMTASLVLLGACSDMKGSRPKPGGLVVGDKAYEFKLMDSRAEWVKLSDIKENWYLVLILYRGSWCSACLGQLTQLKDDYQKFLDAGAAIACVSVESPADLSEFQRQWRFPFPLLSDPQLKLIDAYGARHPKGHEGEDISRATVVIIDSKRVVRYKYIGQTPQDRPHNAEILDLVRRFQQTSVPTP